MASRRAAAEALPALLSLACSTDADTDPGAREDAVGDVVQLVAGRQLQLAELVWPDATLEQSDTAHAVKGPFVPEICPKSVPMCPRRSYRCKASSHPPSGRRGSTAHGCWARYGRHHFTAPPTAPSSDPHASYLTLHQSRVSYALLLQVIARCRAQLSAGELHVCAQFMADRIRDWCGAAAATRGLPPVAANDLSHNCMRLCLIKLASGTRDRRAPSARRSAYAPVSATVCHVSAAPSPGPAWGQPPPRPQRCSCRSSRRTKLLRRVLTSPTVPPRRCWRSAAPPCCSQALPMRCGPACTPHACNTYSSDPPVQHACPAPARARVVPQQCAQCHTAALPCPRPRPRSCAAPSRFARRSAARYCACCWRPHGTGAPWWRRWPRPRLPAPAPPALLPVARRAAARGWSCWTPSSAQWTARRTRACSS
jgi:hypothetical protein